MKIVIVVSLLLVAASSAQPVSVTLTDVKRVETGRTAQCVYTGHGITRTIEVPASGDCKAVMSFETEN